MKVTDKMRDLNLKNMIFIVSYIAVLVLGILKFEDILAFLNNAMNIIQPFIIGFILAFVFNIPMKYFIKKLPIKKKRVKEIVAAALSVLLVLIVISFVIWVILPQVIDNIRTFVNNMPAILDQAETVLESLMTQFNVSSDIIQKGQELQKSIGDVILNSLNSWIPGIASGVGSVASSVVNLFISFVIAIYMVLSKETLLRQFRRVGKAFLSDRYYEKTHHIIVLTSSTFENFLAGQLTESFIIGILCYIGCKILGIPYASIAAIVIGATNIIPYFGPIIGTAIVSLLIVLVSPIKAVVFIVFGTLLQQFESNLIYPHVVGGSVGLSALWVLFAVIVGGGLFGIKGMIFGLPVFSVIYELAKQYTNKRLKEKQIMNE